MSPTINVPEDGFSRSSTGSDEQHRQQPQPGQPGFMIANDNPFCQDQQQMIYSQRTPPATSQITSTFAYSHFAKRQQRQQQHRFPFYVDLNDDHLATETCTAKRGRDPRLSHRLPAYNSSFLESDEDDGFEPKGNVLSPPGLASSQAPFPFDSTPASRSRGTPITPFSIGTSGSKAGATRVLPNSVTLSPFTPRSVLPTIHERQSSDQRKHRTPFGSSRGDSDDTDEYTASLLATLASHEDTIAALNKRLCDALASVPHRRTRDARGRWTSSSARGVRRPRPRGNNGGRRRRRTQAELLMEAGIKFGYLEVPNVSVVTGDPLVALPVERIQRMWRGRNEGYEEGEEEEEEEDEVKLWARELCEGIWRRKFNQN